jgi:hypothetical protein
MAAFTWSEKGRVIGGHAVVFYQPTENSNVFMHDAGGSYDLFTQSHDLDEIVTALNRLMQKTAIKITMPRWLDTEGSREEFAVSKSDRQPVWWSPTASTPTEQTAAYQTGRLLGQFMAVAIGLGLYVWAIVVCFLKGKSGLAVLGIIGFFVPFLSWAAIIGAIRIAKPDSWWARKKYGPEKMKIAHQRFTPFDNEVPKATPVIIDDPVERALERVRRRNQLTTT